MLGRKIGTVVEKGSAALANVLGVGAVDAVLDFGYGDGGEDDGQMLWPKGLAVSAENRGGCRRLDRRKRLSHLNRHARGLERREESIDYQENMWLGWWPARGRSGKAWAMK
jgi:hypothetical protein